MKKFTVILFAFVLLTACNDSHEKPDNLIGEEKMEKILYDVALLQSMSSFAPGVLHDNDIDVNDYIYKKYDIDSLTLAQSHTYYASDFDKYESMLEKVNNMLKEQKATVDSLMKEEKKMDKIKSKTAVDTLKTIKTAK